MSDGFKEYYGEIALQQIEELKNRLSEKEEENSKQKQKLEENSTKLKESAKLLKEKDIALLKLLMKAEKLDFDEAFNTLKLILTPEEIIEILKIEDTGIYTIVKKKRSSN